MLLMKKRFLVYSLVFCFLFLVAGPVMAQCSICTKTAQQLGEGPAKALNGAILYLAFTPLAIIGYLGYRWWKSNREA
jgi:nucleoside recognition membrane protein YjiH